MGAIAISPLPRRFVSRRLDERRAERERLGDLRDRTRRSSRPSSSTSFLYYVVQALTFAILILAANTSYQGFPRLAAVLARDRFFPRQFVNLGDRLVYSNGIIVLAGIAALLIWAFKADVIALIHLYVIGVFTAFTISQAGMVRLLAAARTARLALARCRQRRRRSGDRPRRDSRHRDEVHPGRVGGDRRDPAPGRHASTACAATTARSRDDSGPGVAAVAAAPPATNRVVLYVESFDAALEEAVWYARQIAGDDFSAIHVPGPRTAIRGSFRASASSRACSPTSRSSLPRTAGSTR